MSRDESWRREVVCVSCKCRQLLGGMRPKICICCQRHGCGYCIYTSPKSLIDPPIGSNVESICYMCRREKRPRTLLC
jgi:hypothetical protein